MTAILDTSFLFALTDQSDRNHERVLAVAQSSNETLVLPVAVLPEICYLIASRLGHQVMRHFVTSLTSQAVQVEPVTSEDLLRINEILNYYLESAANVALVGRYSCIQPIKIERSPAKVSA